MLKRSPRPKIGEPITHPRYGAGHIDALARFQGVLYVVAMVDGSRVLFPASDRSTQTRRILRRTRK